MDARVYCYSMRHKLDYTHGFLSWLRLLMQHRLLSTPHHGSAVKLIIVATWLVAAAWDSEEKGQESAHLGTGHLTFFIINLLWADWLTICGRQPTKEIGTISNGPWSRGRTQPFSPQSQQTDVIEHLQCEVQDIKEAQESGVVFVFFLSILTV